MRPEVLVTKPLGQPCLAALEQEFAVHSLVGATDRDALLAEVGARIRGIAGGKVPASLMGRLPALEIIANAGVGVDSIDLETARSRGIRVTNTPGVLNDAVAELTLGLMLALARRIAEADAFVRAGRWPAGPFPVTTQLAGGTLGLLGLGRIGREIAARAAAMKMRVLYHSRTPQPDQPYQHCADILELAHRADWLVVILPGGPDTEGIVSRAVLEALGPEGCLVNVGRGGMVDETALIELLSAGRLGGAALDVFHGEPDIDPALLRLDRVVLSPHQGSRTRQTRAAMEALVLDNLRAHFAGQPLPTPVV